MNTEAYVDRLESLHFFSRIDHDFSIVLTLLKSDFLARRFGPVRDDVGPDGHEYHTVLDYDFGCSGGPRAAGR